MFAPCCSCCLPWCTGSSCICYFSSGQIIFPQITVLLLSRAKLLRGICYLVILLCPQCFDMFSVPIPTFSYFSLNVTCGTSLLQTANSLFVFTYGNFNIFPNTSAFFINMAFKVSLSTLSRSTHIMVHVKPEWSQEKITVICTFSSPLSNV